MPIDTKPDRNPTPRYRLRNILAVYFLKFFSRLSLPANHRLGRLIGKLAWYFPTRARKISLKNLHIYSQSGNQAPVSQLCKQSLQHTGCAFTELGALWLWPRDRIFTLIKEVEGRQHVETALSSGKGVIFITPHIGSWEMIGLYVASHFNLTTMYKAHRIESVSEIMKRGRARFGGQYVAANTQGLAQLMKALRAGNSVGLLPDQDPGYDSGIFTPLFGIQTNTMTLVAKMASKTNAPILACYSERLPHGSGYKIVFRPAIELPADDITSAVTAMNKEVENVIRACPQQYLWSYPRFKRRPDRTEKFYQ